MNPARKPPDTSTYSGRFAVRLRMLREKAGLSVEEVAIETGISTRTWYDWESGRTEPKLNVYPTLAEALGLKVRTLLPEK